MTLQDYRHPELLVSTDWVAGHWQDTDIRIVEVDWDPTTAHNLGHVPGAILVDWRKDMNNPLNRDIIDRAGFEALLGRVGIGNDTIVILYGDFNNWFATYAFWVFKYYGHSDLRIMNGGRKKWIDEKKELSTAIPTYPSTTYKAKGPNESIRAYSDYVRMALGAGDIALVDVRSPAEYKGEVFAPPEYPEERSLRAGHIPGAINQPWGQALKEDGTFKSAQELAELYQGKEVTTDKEIVTYCRIGERSSHTWFVLTYLLGYPRVKNYDGSWTEWGNGVKNPVER